MVNPFLFILVCFIVQVHAQDQSGFISIDCGIADNASYTDSYTGIDYVSDARYIQTSNGISNTISSSYQTIVDKQFVNLRSFPKGSKNCYTVPYPGLNSSARFLVRARFLYGNYDSLSLHPTFDLYFGANIWATIEFGAVDAIVDKEMLYYPQNSSSNAYVCLVNTGRGTPFISALEIRLIDSGIYDVTDPYETLQLANRYDLRAYEKKNIIRYKEDIYDRMWKPSFNQDDFIEVNTTSIITPADGGFMIPSSVMTTAITPANASNPIEFFWLPQDKTAGYYFCMHFADFQSNLTREFNITLNEKDWKSDFIPFYLTGRSIMSPKAEWPAERVNISITKTTLSDLPPIINAFELYTVRKFSNQLTRQEDVNAIQNIKTAYGLKRDWQGDPCLPANFTWKSIGCFNISAIADPRIVLLNLSQNGLTGNISPYIFDLRLLKHLDLSNNNLTGEVPVFLSEMETLEVLMLSGNNLSGVIPPKLLERSNDGLLKLSFEGNPYLCSSSPCITTPPIPVTPIPVTPIPSPAPPPPVGNGSMLSKIISASAAVFIVVAIILVLVWVRTTGKKKYAQPDSDTVSLVTTGVNSGTSTTQRDGPIVSQRQNYTYSEVIQMTQNFQHELGKGGFGSVYRGSVDDIQVAVKMLSPSSAQGYRQFMAEAELLMRVHHRNLTCLVGYCNEGDKLGLIYEFMANGDLDAHLSDKNLECLSWELRLQIVLEAAQGLEYLHYGCKPPIIHRDIKTTNILLNEEMQAKLADFGLSKVFPADGANHVSTAFAGTLGYIDPEFNINESSDVYSYGVVLLEILTGKRPLLSKDKERTHLSDWVARILEEGGDVRNVVDARLNNDFDVNSVWKVVDVAMACVSRFSNERPTMNHVVNELKLCLEMEKARMMKDDHQNNESNKQSTEYSDLNIDFSDTTPIAR